MNVLKKVLLTVLVVLISNLCMAVEWHSVGKDDLGNPGKQPYLMGKPKSLRFEFDGLTDSMATSVFGRKVELTYANLNPVDQYRVKLYFVGKKDGEEQNVSINREFLKKVKLKKGKVTELVLDIPQAIANRGSLIVKIEPNGKKKTASLSYIELFSSEKQTASALKPGERIVIKMIDIENPRISPIPSVVNQVKNVIQDLDGVWKFNSAPKAGFESLTSAKDWADITVPGEWTMQGFNVEEKKAAGYFRTFKVDNDWKGHRLKLRFNSVYSDSVVYVNGKKAGAHLGGFTAFELDVTDLVKFNAVNTLTLSVINESLADSLASGSAYACHPLGGIPRSVSLIALPKVNMSSLIVRTKFDKQYKDATLTVLADLTNEHTTDLAKMKLSFELAPWESSEKVKSNKEVSWFEWLFSFGSKEEAVIKLKVDSVSLAEIKAGQTVALKFSAPVSSPEKWTCETPNLYMLTCTLTQDGKVIETVKQRFGFRDIEVKGPELLVNGMPMALRGLNRHEVYPLTGRSVPKEMYRKDIEIFQEGNVNLLRTCHYQPDEALMEMADELGMFIQCEGPYCWAHKVKENTPAVMDIVVRQNMEMVILNRNHPSVLYWSLGNESRWNNNFAESARVTTELDPTRPIVFDTWGHDGDDQCKIGTKHYPGLRETYGNGNYPKQLGEYCHLNAYNRHEMSTDQALRAKWGMYLHRMWEAMYKDPTCVGGSIWAGIDDTFYWDFKNKDGSIEERTVGYGTWGPIDGWRRPKPEFWGMKKSYSPIRIQMTKIKVSDNEIVVPLENRQDFSNLNRLKVTWKVGGEVGTVTADIKARSTGELIIKTKKSVASGSHLELIFDDPRGFNVDSFKLPLGKSKTKQVVKGGNEQYEMKKSTDKIIISNKRITYTINKKTGLIKCQDFSGPYLMVLPLNCEGGTQMHGPTKFYKPFTDTCTEWNATLVESKIVDGLPLITVKGSYKEATGSFTYTFNADGTFTVNYDFVVTEKVNPRQLGIVFDLPKSFGNLKWKRKGYWTTYPEWHIARLQGEAKASEGFDSTPVGHRTKPDHEWRHDRTSIGNNDFASTKHNIYTASLTNENGQGLEIVADADQHVRAWNTDNFLRLLIATYSNGGAERFLRRISKMDDVPLKKGDKVSGIVVLKIK